MPSVHVVLSNCSLSADSVLFGLDEGEPLEVVINDLPLRNMGHLGKMPTAGTRRAAECVLDSVALYPEIWLKILWIPSIT